jgi:hypothetical protein
LHVLALLGMLTTLLVLPTPPVRGHPPRLVDVHHQDHATPCTFTWASSLSLDVGGRSYRLPAAATAVWRVRAAGGVAMLGARARGNGASYVARFIIRPAR